MSFPTLPTRLDGAELAVETRAVFKHYPPSTTALNGLDLQVPAGAVYVLVGPNGAGKSTAMRLLLDVVRADRGTATVLGIDTARQPALARAQIGYVPEVVDTAYGWLTVRGLLKHHAAFYDAWDWGYADALCRRLGLRPGERFRALSKGGARAVALVTALAHRPPVLLLDEPADGLDPLAREELAAILVEHITHAPTTVLWSTHHVHEADRLADHVGVLRGGRLLLQAPVDAVRGGLRRYRAEVPDGWTGAPGLNGDVLVRAQAGREITWTVWGEERSVAERLSASGAVVREAGRLSLEDAALALLRAGSAA
ncbi:ABC transporter ATP-binding protein [Longimicrobium sp.]|uniref:ABC transporter ATP-binding protein n=1 Tax=Longimicrobium sp. TaxID=2029185 RepID=UPI002E366058|nr:ABC transporter ATP-binding protein [Longimicrobium sp.]HEX6039153.1 ABC transporter ATP-binding protein [Longimicrobium sp.]